MKRLALIVSALAVTATAHAQDATEFKNGGEFRLRYENFLNKSAADDSAREQHFDSRLKWNMNVRKGEKLQAYVGLLHSARFGGADVPAGATPTTQTSYQPADNNSLVVNRVWGWWRASDAVSFKVGRMGIEFADGAVFSENDWQAVPYAHEGLNAAFDTSFAMFNLYGVKQAEFGTPATNDNEANYYLGTMDLKNMPEAIKMANVHVLAVTGSNAAIGSASAANTAAAAQANQNWQQAGFTVGGDVVGIMYKATAAFQFGDFAKGTPAGDISQSSNMFDLMLGWGNPELMGFKISAGYHQDSGEDASTTENKRYQTLFYDRHNYAGLMDFVEWGNLTYWNVNASFMPREDLEVGAGYYMFSKTESAGATAFGDGSSRAGNTVAATGTGNDDLGSELDVFANKSYGSDFKIGARYSMFMPGDAVKDLNAGDKTASQIYLQTSLSF